MKKRPPERRPPPSEPPPDLRVLESEEGDFAVLSFGLVGGDASGLTPSESEVMAHLVAGRSNAEIAVLRGSSPRTVANQVASVFRKLGVASRLELVALAPFLAPQAGRSTHER